MVGTLRFSLSLSEFLRDVLREKKERMDAAEMRDGIFEGRRYLIEGRVLELKGNLRATLGEARRREKQNWKSRSCRNCNIWSQSILTIRVACGSN
ncbi:MAG: hypothetical protein ACREIC_01445 [Limisphaerales bacterium]